MSSFDPLADPPILSDPHRKRLLYRALHRGSKEADLLLGGFARARLAHLTVDQVARLDALLEEQDLDILDWVIGRAPVPPHHDTDILQMLRSFQIKP